MRLILPLLLLPLFISAQDLLVGGVGDFQNKKSGKNEKFGTLARAGVNVSGVNAVLVIGSFDARYFGSNETGEVWFMLSDGSSESPIIRQSLKYSDHQDRGIGTLVHIFETGSLKGNKNFLLKGTTNTKNSVTSAGTVVAIALTTSSSLLDLSHDLKSITSPVYTSGNLNEWAPVAGLTTQAIELLGEGDIYLSASVNSFADGTGSGEWKLQHSSNQSNWVDVGHHASRAFNETGVYGISSLSWIMKDLPAGSHYFRVAHRQTAGTAGDLRTTNSSLAACALNFEDAAGSFREFPAFVRQNASSTTTGTSMSPVINHSVDPANASDLFLHAQYMATADASEIVAAYDLAIDQAGYNGPDQYRFLPSSADLEGGGSVGLVESLQAGSSYTVSLRHLSASGTSLTTRNATLAGFQLTSTGTTTWTGASLTYPNTWGDEDNWTDMVPADRENAIIPGDLTNYPILTSSIACEDLQIGSGASITMNPLSNLTIHGNLQNGGNLEAQANASNTASLIVKGQATGNMDFQSYLTHNKWHIVSPPVSGQVISTFLTDPANQIPKKTDADIYALTDYNEASNSWNGFFAGSVPGNFTTGKGYLMRREISDGPVSYSGTIVSNDHYVSIPATGSGWNAVGNPFSSAIGATEEASTAQNFLTTNLDQLDPNYGVIYIWVEVGDYSGTQNNYKVIGNAGYVDAHAYDSLEIDYLQAGQGFIVKAKEGGGSLLFSKAMQVHNNSTPFFKSTPPSWNGFKLVAEKGERSESTIVSFHSGMTMGLDPSYDAGLLSSKPDFSIYTYLPEADSGIQFKIQCLPDSIHGDVVIPLGVDLLEGGEVSFFTEGIRMPDGYEIHMEDRKLGQTFDLTSEEKGFRILLGDGGAVADRFFLHITYPDMTLPVWGRQREQTFHAYYSQQHITVIGTVNNGALAYLHDIGGRRLKSFRLRGGDRHQLPVAEFDQGIYLVTVVDASNKSTLKVFKNQP